MTLISSLRYVNQFAISKHFAQKIMSITRFNFNPDCYMYIMAILILVFEKETFVVYHFRKSREKNLSCKWISFSVYHFLILSIFLEVINTLRVWWLKHLKYYLFQSTSNFLIEVSPYKFIIFFSQWCTPGTWGPQNKNKKILKTIHFIFIKFV